MEQNNYRLRRHILQYLRFFLQWQDMCNRTIYIVSHFPIWIHRHHYHMKRVLERYHHRQNTHTAAEREIETQIRSHSHLSSSGNAIFQSASEHISLSTPRHFYATYNISIGVAFYFAVFFLSSRCAVMQIRQSAIAADVSQLVLLVFFSLSFPRPIALFPFFYSFSCIFLKGA